MDEPTKRGRGRPKLPSGKTRVTLATRVKPETRKEIERQAKAAGLGISELLDRIPLAFALLQEAASSGYLKAKVTGDTSGLQERIDEFLSKPK